MSKKQIDDYVKVNKTSFNSLLKTHEFRAYKINEDWFIPSSLNINKNCNIMLLILDNLKPEHFDSYTALLLFQPLMQRLHNIN